MSKLKAMAESTRKALTGKKKKEEEKDERSFLDKLSDAMKGPNRKKMEEGKVKEKAKRKLKRYKNRDESSK